MEKHPEVDGVTYTPGVLKKALYGENGTTCLTKLRIYASKSKAYSKVIHALIHATNEDVINLHKHCIKDKGMLEKLNTLRILANNKPITI